MRRKIMKKTISIFISVMMIVALICIVPAQAEAKTEGLDNNAPSKTDIINYLQDHKDEIWVFTNSCVKQY